MIPAGTFTATAPKDASDLLKQRGPEAIKSVLSAANTWTPKIVEQPPSSAGTSTAAAPVHVMSLDEILGTIRSFIRSRVFLPRESQSVAIALWVAHTWVFEAFDFTPYLSIQSPAMRCGKSTLLDCLALITRQPWQAVSPTEAVLYRKIEKDRPTLLLDEVDAIFTGGKSDPSKEGLRGIINAGFQRSATVPRCSGAAHDIKDFSVFCPKALAGIGKLPGTIADRAIPIVLARKPKGHFLVKNRRREALLEVSDLVASLQHWANADVITALGKARPNLPESLGSRAADICEPLISIADLAGNEWPELARRSLIDLCEEGATEEDGNSIRLLSDIRQIFADECKEKLSTKEILTALIEVDSDSPWAHWWEREVTNGLFGGPSGSMARLLRLFEIKPTTIRADTGPVKGYYLKSFETVFEQYLPPLKGSPEPETTV